MIKVGNNPEGIPGVNKFVTPDGEGHRGVVVAMFKTHAVAIVVAAYSEAEISRRIEWGRMYLVEDQVGGDWPMVVASVDHIPKDPGWRLVSAGATTWSRPAIRKAVLAFRDKAQELARKIASNGARACGRSAARQGGC